ncbi:MAG: hypothetical protein J6D37_01410 [Clostridia bacterium]|nr:hypothetical protein [Clostridia bacterium]
MIDLRFLRKPSFWVGSIAYLAAIVVIALMLTTAGNDAIWLDEAFSYGIVEYDFLTVAAHTAGDVHPPLYYCILKVVIDLTSLFGADRIVVGKVVSVLPFVALAIYAAIFVRKDFGFATAGIFSLVICIMPNLFRYSSEVRMYTWCMAFTLAALIHAYEVMKAPEKLFPWFALSFHTLCAAYTQYFALIAVFFVWLGVFIVMLCKFRKFWLRFVLFAGGTVLLYLPWLLVLLKVGGMSSYTGGVDFSKVNFRDFYKYHFFAVAFETKWGQFHQFVMVLSLIILALSIVKHRLDEVNLMAIVGGGVYLGLVFVLILMSAFTSHDLFNRYIFPAVGCLWYPVVVLSVRLVENPLPAWKEKGKDFPAICKKALPAVNGLVALTLLCSVTVTGFFSVSNGLKTYRAETEAFESYREQVLDKVEEGDYVVTDSDLFALPVLYIQLPKAHVCSWIKKGTVNWNCKNSGVIEGEAHLLSLLESGETVWVFATGALSYLKDFAADRGYPVKEYGYFPNVDTVNCAGSTVYQLN